ncbi:MAG: redoxin domain-containing protein [Verrucomicrobiota bacterium]
MFPRPFDGTVHVVMRPASLPLILAAILAPLLAVVPTAHAQGTTVPPVFKRYNLRCLAPLLKDLDPEEPENLDQAFLAGPAGSAERVSNDDPASDERVGTSAIRLPITTKSPDAQSHFNRGLALLHTLWYREAEHAFRSVVHHDPDCAMGYWGLAMANELRPGRARLFARTAVMKSNRSLSPIETRWIQILANYYEVSASTPLQPPQEREIGSNDSLESRTAERLHALEDLVIDFPDEIEPKAFLLRQLALDKFRANIPVTTTLGAEHLAQELAQNQPDHPSRHYLIFLWLDRRPERGIAFANSAPHLSPGVAETWRYAGEAYAAADRLHEAITLYEAALRVDHQLMEQRLLMPAETENLGGNYEVLIQTLADMGRIDEALDWSKRATRFPTSMLVRENSTLPLPEVDLPAMGHRLSLELLARGERWETLLEEATADSNRLADFESRSRQLFWKGLALHFLDRGDEVRATADEVLQLLRTALKEGVSNKTERSISASLGALQACSKLLQDASPAAFSTGTAPDLLTPQILILLYDKAGLTNEAASLARDLAASHPRRVYPVATHCYLAFKSDNRKEASLHFNRLFRADAARTDPDLPALRRLDPLAADMQLPTPWTLPTALAVPPSLPADLSDLGPGKWTPPLAPDFSLQDHAGKIHSLADFKGKPVLINFFLGIRCAFCLEQLNVFKPHLEEFTDAGIEFVSISSDSLELLQENFGKLPEKRAGFEEEFPYLVLADPALESFKSYRAFDDFEDGPLHATVLIDGDGRVRWADRGHSPFREPSALLREAQRLLALEIP